MRNWEETYLEVTADDHEVNIVPAAFSSEGGNVLVNLIQSTVAL